MTFILLLMLGLNIVFWGATFERGALSDGPKYMLIVGALGASAALARWRTERDNLHETLRFEEELPPCVTSLGLQDNL
jgi:hypothetical protein